MPKECVINLEVKGLSGWRLMIIKAIGLFDQKVAVDFAIDWFIVYRINGGTWKRFERAL